MHPDDRIDLVEDGPRFKQGNRTMILFCVLLWVVTMVIFIGVGKFYSIFLGILNDISFLFLDKCRVKAKDISIGRSALAVSPNSNSNAS